MEKIITKKDIMKEVKFTVAKDAFEGPFTCCKKITKKTHQHVSYQGISVDYDVWKCNKCHKEYLDTNQAKKLETFWIIQKIVDDRIITMERNINFDGKTYFFRFPKELTQHWSKHQIAEIKLIDQKTFLVEIKQ
ncbi:MAG TPA: hypothetical protein VJB87_02435 [Candidatus Nanoarchaeia archaeon]|nr:hypothetical protein [Candidatus Nanoarchaeia archaeon]